MKLYPIIASVLVLLACSASSLIAQQSADQGKWIPLFNGKDLTGWKVKIKGYELNDNFGDTFRVVDGVIKVAYDKYDKFDNRFGHMFYEKPFSNYILRVEYRFVGEQVPEGPGWAFRNSGIMLHGQSPESMRKDQDFPVSVEVQLLGGAATGERSTGNVCTPGTHIVMDGKLITRHCNDSRSKTYRGDQWVTIEVEVHGSGRDQAHRQRRDGDGILATATRRERPRCEGTHKEWPQTALRRLHLAAIRESSRGVPQSGNQGTQGVGEPTVDIEPGHRPLGLRTRG